MAKSYYNILETLVNICAVEQGTLKIFLKRKMTEPYKGYWILPGRILSKDENLEQCAGKVVLETTNLPSMFLMQSKTFSNIDRDPDERIIACTFTALTAKNLVEIRQTETQETNWFDINALPKMGYDHLKIIEENMVQLKKRILNNEQGILLKLFPSDFTLPELQKFFENITGRELDRRNFRKKITNDEIVEDTGVKNIGGAGRPGKLYRFNKSFGEGSIIE